MSPSLPEVRFAGRRSGNPTVLAVGVPSADVDAAVALVRESDRTEAAAFLADVEHSGAAGVVHTLPRPGRRPSRMLFVGTGAGEPGDWRAAGAALARAARKDPGLTVLLPDALPVDAVGALAEGLWLAGYRYREVAEDPDKAAKLRRVVFAVEDERADAPELAAALSEARHVVDATMLARDLTNTPSNRKSPAWFAQQVTRAARGMSRLTVTVRTPVELAAEGFNGILAVGRGSAHTPRLVELAWRPPGATRHVVLVGKGITFDTGGVSIKPREGMKLMRKDMGGAAAVIAATIGAAALGLPVRVTALAPLAENALGADSYRPGDVVRHYGGRTSEILNTDAEGRVVLADAISYAVARLRPDVLVDLATLTAAQGVALGKRTAALYTENNDLADTLGAAAAAAGERVWRMPLPDDGVEDLRSDVADLVNSTDVGAGSVMAALYLREFTGALRDRWVHMDMSAPAWADSNDAELSKGATGWGVRTLLRWLATDSAD